MWKRWKYLSIDRGHSPCVMYSFRHMSREDFIAQIFLKVMELWKYPPLVLVYLAIVSKVASFSTQVDFPTEIIFPCHTDRKLSKGNFLHNNNKKKKRGDREGTHLAPIAFHVVSMWWMLPDTSACETATQADPTLSSASNRGQQGVWASLWGLLHTS